MKCDGVLLKFVCVLFLLILARDLYAHDDRDHQWTSHHHTRSLISLISSKRTLEDGLIFKEVTNEVGFQYSDVSFGHAWSDINKDGFPDLFASGHGKAQLYINRQDGTFEVIDLQMYRVNDTIDGEVIPKSYFDMHGSIFTDVNYDGYPDLYIQLGGDMGRSSGKENLLFLNDKGTLKFENSSKIYGIQDSLGRGRSSLFFDVNQDGYLDFINCNLIRNDFQFNTSLYTYDTGQELFHRNQDVGLQSSAVRGAFLIQSGISSKKYLLSVVDDVDNIEIYDYTSVPFAHVVSKKHYGVRDLAIADFNGDSVQDFFSVSNRSGSEVIQMNDSTLIFHLQAEKNRLGYTDENKISFKSDGVITITSKVYPYKGNVAQYWRIGKGAYNPNSEVFTLDPKDEKNHNFANLCILCLGVNIGYNTSDQKWEIYNSDPIDNLQTSVVITSSQPIYDVKTYHFQNSDLLSSDKLFIAQKSGGYMETQDFLLNDENLSTGTSVVAADFDNDMDMDILISCTGAATNYPNRYYENDGTGKFKMIGDFGATSHEGGRSGSMSTVDYNNDGFLDVFIENGEGLVGEGSKALAFNDGPYRLFQNKGNQNHWLKIHLSDDESLGNKLAIGASIYCYSGGKKQIRVKGNETHIYAQNDPVIHFGLAQNKTVDSLQIIWPNGKMTTYYGLEADTTYTISNAQVELGWGSPQKDCTLKIYPNPSQNEIYVESAFTGYFIDQVLIYDYLGNLVKSLDRNEYFVSSVIPIDHLVNGTYILQLIYNDGKVCYDRFQIGR